jgi:predicted Zn-dependent protease with MMP-like domain
MRLDDVCTIVDTALADLPTEVQSALAQVDIIVVDGPEDESCRSDKLPPDFQGVFIGTPQEDVDPDEGRFAAPPSGKIFLNASKLKSHDETVRVLYHEVGHAFGWDEADVQAMGLDFDHDP